MCTQNNIKNICYMLNSFPNPSETFISDEAVSMIDLGITPFIIALTKGDMTVVQRSAKRLMSDKLFTIVQPVTKVQSLKAVVQLFFMKPYSTLVCLFKALTKKNRMIFFQSAPYAVMVLKKKIQFIHSHFADINFAWAGVLSLWTGIPFGVTTHRYDLFNDPLPMPTAAELFSRANLLVTISDYNRNLMVEKYGIPFNKIKIVHCGVDLERFKMHGNFAKFIQKKLRFINIGRLVPEKGQDILVQGLAKAKDQGVQFEMVIVGEGPWYNRLTALCKTLKLEDCVRFVGAQTQISIIEMLQQSDAFILSSRTEGIPVVCMEAMAMGLCVIATGICGIPELIQDKVSGLLVAPEDVNGLAEAIVWIDQHRDSLGKMCESAREKVELAFNRHLCTQLLLDTMCNIHHGCDSPKC